MEKINAVITGVGGYVPDYILTNEEISKMVDTTDEWIMGRIGIKERRILHEEGIIRKSKFPQNPKRSVRFSGKRTKRSVQKRKARNTQKAETKVL